MPRIAEEFAPLHQLLPQGIKLTNEEKEKLTPDDADTLVMGHLGSLYSMANRVARHYAPRVTYEDTCSQAILYAYQVTPKWNPKKGRYTTFIYGRVPFLLNNWAKTESVVYVPHSKPRCPEALDRYYRARDQVGEIKKEPLKANDRFDYDLWELLWQIVEEVLNEREKEIFFRVYMGETQTAIAKDMGISNKRIGQLKRNAESKIRDRAIELKLMHWQQHII